MESASLVAIPNSRLPEMLGNFHLDNHHVEEWSDPSEPGLKHRARKEVGKWVNTDKNADIHYQKQEDSKKSDRSQERSQTEVIKGSAPDSTFQVVRAHRQYQDGDENSGSKSQQTSSTSYHVSSSRGVRSTTKTTSNKTTTKTVTVSGGNRADDFENLRMSFTPLDTSTQRERINVSRSETMGIRRPPTRRHTPAALLCSSPEDGPEVQRPEDGQILVDSDDNLRDTPDPDMGKISDPVGISIVGFKNISPKIRVGFPVEIQLELQTKLKFSSTVEKDQHQVQMDRNLIDSDEHEYHQENYHKETESAKPHKLPIESSVAVPIRGLPSVSSRNTSYDFQERRKSFLSENFENENAIQLKNSNQRRSSMHLVSSNREDVGRASYAEMNSQNQRHSAINFPSNTSSKPERYTGMSWDLIQSIEQYRRKGEGENNKHQATMLSSEASSSGEDYTDSHKVSEDESGLNDSKNVTGYGEMEIRRDSFSQRLRTINAVNNNHNNAGGKKTVVTLNASEESFTYDGKDSSEGNEDSLEVQEDDREREKESFESTTDFQYHAHPLGRPESHLISTPDVLHHDNNSSANSLSPSLERSRKLLKMLDETPDLLNKMSFKSYFSTAATTAEKQDEGTWGVEVEEVDTTDMDWETQRQLSFLNDSLSRILDESQNSIDYKVIGGAEGADKMTTALRRLEAEMDFNGNLQDVVKMNQVSQTWISSADHKPSQTARDNDVVTSISATNDAYKNIKGQKRVEFCKTEVHFTPDSGRFNIVETDENKPSTAHLFRRKKRSERKAAAAAASTLQTATTSSSSSMSSLDSNTDKQETAYILEMQVNSESNNGSGNSVQKKNSGKSSNCDVSIIYSSSHSVDGKVSTKMQLNEGKMIRKLQEHLDSAGNSIRPDQNSLPALTTKSDSERSEESGGERSHRVFVNLEEAESGVPPEDGDDIRSPSHTILSNYGEMKIQRYLKQLKSNSNSRENSSSPAGSPTPQSNENGQWEDEHFRFDNILYENGSFVPLATRRSLIEMNNRNRRRMNAAASQSSDNSSTTSTYSLPTSDKDQNGTLRLGSVEATVVTSGSQPQITAVEFNYAKHRTKEEQKEEELEYHNLSVRERRERFSSVPSPVMPHYNGRDSKNYMGQSAMSPTDSQASDRSSPQRPSSSTYLSKKPPTPILPIQFATFTKTGAELRERFYAKNSNTNANKSCLCVMSDTEVNTGGSRSIRSNREGKLSAKSVITIGSNDSYSEANQHNSINDMDSSQEMIVTAATIQKNHGDSENGESLSLEPILSLDHTWKGPAHFENQQPDSLTRREAGSRSLTYSKSPRMMEPEWVSKAKSRETRVTDWSLIEKQQQTTTSPRNTEPPWISEIRIRNKPVSGNEEVKSFPKISVVYPWHRESSSKESSMEREDTVQSEYSHILSIIPEPVRNGSLPRKDKQFGSFELFSGKSLPPIKSLKSVPEVSMPGRKGRSIVEVHSEPEHYIHSSPKTYHQGLEGRKEIRERKKSGSTLSRAEKKSASTRLISESGRISSRDDESNLTTDSFSKKSRKPLQQSQANKDGLSRAAYKLEEKVKAQQQQQQRPPKPPQRVTSLSKEEHQSMNNRDAALMTIPPFRVTGRSHHHKERGSGGGSNSNSTILTHSVASSSRKSSSKRNKPTSEEFPGSPGDNLPVHHRHPTVQITKLPMRTAKVSVVDGKRVSSSAGGNSGSSKSKPKHNASSSPPTKGENVKPQSVRTPNSTAKSSSAGSTPNAKGKVGQSPTTTSNCNANPTRKPKHTMSATKPAKVTPLKTSTRPPSLDIETKKRKTTSTLAKDPAGRKSHQ